MRNVVKITSGIYRGRAIATPGDGTHPMGERERLALFNMLGGLDGLAVLDAFAGSGALGIEALSRGAGKVVFVEKNRAACKVILSNLLVLEASGEVICGDVAKYEGGDFDVILADPPYDKFNIETVATLTKSLKNGGVLVLSHPGESPEIPNLTLSKTRQYASAHLSFYNKLAF